MKKTELNRCAYDFSVYYDVTDVDDIKNIHKNLMKKYIYSIINTYVPKDNSCKVTYKNVCIC